MKKSVELTRAKIMENLLDQQRKTISELQTENMNLRKDITNLKSALNTAHRMISAATGMPTPQLVLHADDDDQTPF